MFTIQQAIQQNSSEDKEKNKTTQPTPRGYTLYRDTITQGENTSTEATNGENQTTKQTTYDLDKAAEFGKKEQALQQPYIDSNNALTEQYISSLDDIYQKYNPDKVKPLQDDERLANIQALSVALGDLARAFGKSAGNRQGLGMVKVDNDSKFVNMLNKAWSTRDKRRTAEAEEGLRQVNQMITNLKERYATNKDNQKILKQAYDKGVERYLRDNNTTTTATNGTKTTTKKSDGSQKVYRNPNSQEAKNEQERMNIARQRLSLSQQRFEHDKGKWEKENIFPNIYYKRFGYKTEAGKALHDSESIYFSDDEVRKYYAEMQKLNLFEKYIPKVSVDAYGNVRKTYTPSKNLQQQKEDFYKLLLVATVNKNNDVYRDVNQAFDNGNFKTETLGH